MPPEAMQLPSGGGVDDDGAGLVHGQCEHPAVGAERRPAGVEQAFERAEELSDPARVGLPQRDGVILSRDIQPAAVSVPGNVPRHRRPGGESPSRFRVPEDDRAVLAYGSQPLAVADPGELIALAGSGQGKDGLASGETSRAKLRRQALDWTQADLILREAAARIQGMPEIRADVSQTLTYGKAVRDLAGIRDPEAIAKFPDEDQWAWRFLWAEVDALARSAQR